MEKDERACGATEGGGNIKEVKVNRIIEDLLEKFDWLSEKLKTVRDDEVAYLRTIDAYQKILKSLYDFLKLTDIQTTGDDIAKLLEKLPDKIEKRLWKLVR